LTRKPAYLPVYVPVGLINMSSPIAVGMIFASLDAAKDALLRHTVARGESYITQKRAAKCFITKCRSNDCPYRVRFTLKKQKDWVVTIYTEHTCSPETHHGWKQAQSVRYLASNHVDSFKLDPTMKPSRIRLVEDLNGNEISYMQSWRALRKIKRLTLDNETASSKSSAKKRRRDWRVRVPTKEEEKKEKAYEMFLTKFINKHGRLPMSADEDPCMAEFEAYVPSLRRQKVVKMLNNIQCS
jgi:MuDR family transposase